MRLLWMTEHYHPGAGGMAQSCDRIVHGLRRSGIAIDVAYLVAADSGIYVRAVERAGGRDIQVAAGGDRGVALNALHAWLSAGGARDDWVAACGGHLPVLAAPTFAAWFGARLAVLLRGNDFDAGIFSPQKRPHLLEALAKADVVCGVSRDKVEKVTALFPYQNALHTPNGIDLARWSILPSQAAWAQAWRARHLPDGGVAIGLVGHLKPKKGLSFFLDALRASHAAERLHLMVVGSLDEAVAEQLAAHRATIRYSFFRSASAGGCRATSPRAITSRCRHSPTGCRTCFWRRAAWACRYSARWPAASPTWCAIPSTASSSRRATGARASKRSAAPQTPPYPGRPKRRGSGSAPASPMNFPQPPRRRATPES
ncbi:MAG: hypothetical protein R3F11_30540 [Verrucomicrobiales bacterium]